MTNSVDVVTRNLSSILMLASGWSSHQYENTLLRMAPHGQPKDYCRLYQIETIQMAADDLSWITLVLQFYKGFYTEVFTSDKLIASTSSNEL